ncbi:MAG: AIR synthase related protein [Evtepia sp.]
MSDIGGFGGLFEPGPDRHDASPSWSPAPTAWARSSSWRSCMDKHDTVGIDCVAMCVNDIICVGAKPLFFLDYIAVRQERPGEDRRASSPAWPRAASSPAAALIGGETAEMPGFYPIDEYDLAGFSVGVVDKDKMLGQDHDPARRRDPRPALLRACTPTASPWCARSWTWSSTDLTGLRGGPGRQVPG